MYERLTWFWGYTSKSTCHRTMVLFPLKNNWTSAQIWHHELRITMHVEEERKGREGWRKLKRKDKYIWPAKHISHQYYRKTLNPTPSQKLPRKLLNGPRVPRIICWTPPPPLPRTMTAKSWRKITTSSFKTQCIISIWLHNLATFCGLRKEITRVIFRKKNSADGVFDGEFIRNKVYGLDFSPRDRFFSRISSVSIKLIVQVFVSCSFI